MYVVNAVELPRQFPILDKLHVVLHVHDVPHSLILPPQFSTVNISQELVSPSQYSELLEIIKENKDEWVSYYQPMEAGW